VEKIIITRRELIRQIPADLSEHDRTVSLLNALFERLPENTEKENVDLQSGDFDEAFRLLNAFDPRTYGTVQLGESLREEQTDTAKEHVGVLGLSDTALPSNDYVGEVTGAGSADTGYYYLLATDETYADTFKNPDHTTRGLIVSGTAYTALLSENVVLTGYDYFGTYKDGGWLFNRCDEAKSTLTVDSIQGNFNSYPYEMKTYSRQHIIRSSSVTERSLVTTCRLRNVTRSDNNPQGFLIESFTIIENRDIGQYER